MLCNKKENRLKLRLIILILTFTSYNINSQENKIVEGKYNSVSSFIGYSEGIENLNQVPKNIKLNLETYLKIILGNWYDKITYFEGLDADLDGYFKEKPLAYKRGWLATKYQFVYLLSDETIGISKYYIKLIWMSMAKLLVVIGQLRILIIRTILMKKQLNLLRIIIRVMN